MNATPKQDFVGAKLSTMMFLQFFVWGGWYVTAGNYMGAMKMSDEAVGYAYSVGPLAAILSPFFLGMVADRFFSTEKVLGVLHILGGAALVCAPMVADSGEVVGGVRDSGAFILVLLAHMLLYMPTLGLTNSLAMSNMTNQEKQFPLIRVFGTIGWIVANVVVSKCFHADALALQFYIAGGVGVAMGFYCFFLPHTPPPAKGKKVKIKDLFCVDALSLLKEKSFLVFIVCSTLICIPLATYYSWGPVFIKDMGFEAPAFTMSFGQMSEILFMVVMPFFFVRLGVKKMLLVGMGAWVLRYVLFSFGAPDSVMWMIYFGVILHGICYDFFFVTGQIYVDKKANPEIRSQAQGLLVLVTQGIGMLAGAQIMAKLKSDMVVTAAVDEATQSTLLGEWSSYWLIPGITAGVILVVFWLFFKDKGKKEAVSNES